MARSERLQASLNRCWIQKNLCDKRNVKEDYEKISVTKTSFDAHILLVLS